MVESPASVDWVVLVSRWLHLAAVITAVGGVVFMRLALMPAARESLDAETHEGLREAVRARWFPFIHGSIAVLLLTGILNFYFLALAPGIKPMPYHAIFGVKFLLAMFVFFVAIALHGRSPAAESMQRARGKWLTAVVIAAGLIVLLSGVLSQLRG